MQKSKIANISTNNIEILQSLPQVGFMMAGFNIVYSIWYGFAWGLVGWILFSISMLLSIYIFIRSIHNLNYSKQFDKVESESGKAIEKKMGILSGISYGCLWVAVIILLISRQYRFILPAVTLIIGVHFIPQAKIFNHKIYYYGAVAPIVSSSTAFYMCFTSTASWLETFSIAGIGGSIAVICFGFYVLISYQKIISRVN